MKNEKNEFSAIAPDASKIDSERETAKKELLELGLEANDENLNAVMEQRATLQHPEGFGDVLANLNNPEKLKEIMRDREISSIVHSEGANVWDHAKCAIQEIDSMKIPDEDKNDLKIIMLYHDLGKTVSGDKERSIEKTWEGLKKGEVIMSMIGHHKERLDDIEAGFKANGITGDKLKTFITVVENHMNTSIPDLDPKKTFELIDGFGENDDKKKEVVKLLANVLQIDGNAAQKIYLSGDELIYTKNEKKLGLDFSEIWKKYEKGREELRKKQEQENRKKAEANFEISIFGKKLSEYLMQDRGIAQGPDMGKATGKIKGIVAANKDRTPAEIKEIVDKAEI